MRTDEPVAEPVAEPGLGLPGDAGKLRLRLVLLVALVLAAVALIVLLPGLGDLRSRFSRAKPGWLALGGALKVLSIVSYVVLFRAVFCRRMSWRAGHEVAISELGANALIPAGGAGGLALGAWALHRGGMPAERIAHRTVAFALLTSATNVIALIIVGLALAAGLAGGHASLALTLIPAAVAALAIIATVVAGRLAHRIQRRLDRRHPGRISRPSKLLGALGKGIDETLALMAEHNRSVVVGAIGYLAFDVMIVWATFHAYGSAPPVAIIWIAYLIGQLGGILPLPGGIGGVDGGLIGMYTVYGVSVGSATAAVLSYRVLALWIPALLGSVAFVALRRRLRLETDRFAVCHPGDEINVGLGPIRAWVRSSSAPQGQPRPQSAGR